MTNQQSPARQRATAERIRPVRSQIQKPPRQRRKAERPTEIVAAAAALFAEQGFAGTRLDAVARRAGVAKGTLYLYFDTKEDLFRAIAQAALEAHTLPVAQADPAAENGVEIEIPRMLDHVAGLLADGQLGGIARMVIAESRTFPDLARIWYEDVAARLIADVAGMVGRAQTRGEVCDGDPRIHAFSIVAPVLTGTLFREMFGPVGADLLDLHAIARQHARILLRGLLTTPSISTLQE